MDIRDFLDFGSLMAFYIGFMFGMVLFVLIYLYTIIRSLNKNRYLVNVQAYDIDAREIENLVADYQDNFKKDKIKGMGENFVRMAHMSTEMTQEIATRFFPKSKYPTFEMSIDEGLMLMTYVSKRLDEILDHRGLRMFRKIRIAQIIGWSNMKKNIEESAIVQADKKLGLRKKLTTAIGVINIINPAYWVRKVVIDRSINVVARKICIITLGIVGEETFKIYSKSLFNEEMHIDTGVDKFFNELRDDLDKEGFEETVIEENEND